MDNAHDQQCILADTVENAMLPKPPAAQAKSAGLFNLPRFGVFAKESKCAGEASVILVARCFAVHRSPIGKNIEQVCIGSYAEVKPLHEPCERLRARLRACAC